VRERERERERWCWREKVMDVFENRKLLKTKKIASAV
jgi:hypothetical protein